MLLLEPDDVTTPAQNAPVPGTVPDRSDHTRGLYRKYNVSRADGKDDPAAEYFVLRLDKGHKPELAAMRAYIEACEAEYPQLAADLRVRYFPGEAARPGTSAAPELKEFPPEHIYEIDGRLYLAGTAFRDDDVDYNAVLISESAYKHDITRYTYVLLHKGRYYRFSAYVSYANGLHTNANNMFDLQEVRPVARIARDWEPIPAE